MTIKAWPNIRAGTGEVLQNLKIFWFLENFKNYLKNQLKIVFKNMTSVPCFRIWDHFSPFRVLGFGVIFRRSMF